MQGSRIDLKECRLAHTSALYQFVTFDMSVFLGPNTRGEPRPIAGATQGRKLLGVGSSAGFGAGMMHIISAAFAQVALGTERL